MITIPSNAVLITVLIVSVMTLLVLMTCQWLIGGVPLRSHPTQTPRGGIKAQAKAEFDRAA
jgi:hypothetical protein